MNDAHTHPAIGNFSLPQRPCVAMEELRVHRRSGGTSWSPTDFDGFKCFKCIATYFHDVPETNLQHKWLWLNTNIPCFISRPTVQVVFYLLSRKYVTIEFLISWLLYHVALITGDEWIVVDSQTTAFVTLVSVRCWWFSQVYNYP